MTKKLCCLLLLFSFIITSLNIALVSAKETDIKEVTLKMYSNVAPDKTHISGLYKDNLFYVDLETFCEISGVEIITESDNYANIFTNSGVRKYELFFDKQILVEKNCEAQNITMPSMIIDQTKYVSALHLLRYIGADVSLDNSAIQLKIIVRYNIFDAVADCANNNAGHIFYWSEVDYNGKSIEDKIVDAGVVSLINKDSDILKMIFNPKGIEKECIEDALISIIKNEGQNTFEDNSGLSTLKDLSRAFDDVFSEVIDFVLKTYECEENKKLGNIIDKLTSCSTFTISTGVNILNAIESVKQYDNISQLQINILNDTIIDHSEDSELLQGKDWSVVLNASESVSKKVEDAYFRTMDASYEVFEKTAVDVLNAVIDYKDPVTLAWEGTIAAMKLIPFTSNMIDKMNQLYTAYNCSMIQYIANQIFSKAYSDLYYNDYLYTQVGRQLEHFNQMKSGLTLQYKSTLTARELLISSGYSTEDYKTRIEAINEQTAILLNQLENCKIVLVGVEPSVEEDLSWLEDFKIIEEGESESESDISYINYYNSENELVYCEKYAYYENGMLASTTMYSIDSSYITPLYVPEYTILYLYDEKGNITDKIVDTMSISEWFDDETGELILDYEYDDEGNSEKIVIYPEKESIEQEKYAVDPSKTQKVKGEAIVLPSGGEWANIYLDKLFAEEEPTDMTQCRLINVNDDTIPELWMDYGYGYAGSEIYTQAEGETDSVYISHGSADWIDRNNILITRGGHMDAYTDMVYEIKDGRFKELAKGDYGALDNNGVVLDEYNNIKYDYYWNDTKVTKEEYENNLNSFFDLSKSYDIYQNIYTYNQCKLLLEMLTENNIEQEDERSSLDDMPIVEYDSYKGNDGDSTVFNLNGKGLSQCDDGKTFVRYGNTGIDESKFYNGFEVWIARWNGRNEISWASATFDLGGEYSTLSGKTNLIKSYNTRNFDTTVYFYDGEELLASYRLTDSDYVKDIFVDVGGVEFLKLYVKDNTATKGGTSFALYDMFLDGNCKSDANNINDSIPSDALEYNKNRYKVYYDTMTWTEAAEFCEDLGGHLAVITDKREQEFIVSAIEGGNQGHYWLGATDSEKDGEWKWVTGEEFSYTCWKSNEPNDDFNKTEDYLGIYQSTKNWNDFSNYGRSNTLTDSGFICEWETG